MSREERIEKWVTLLTQAGITQANHDKEEIVCVHIEGPAVLPPQEHFIICIPKFQDYLTSWEDEDEFMEIYERLPKGDEDAG